VPVRIAVAGDGPDDALLRARLAPQEAGGTVRFLGRVPAAEVAERVYRNAQALLVTSSWETGPIVAWEAMARGVCVVSSRYVGSGLEGALVDGENCLLFPVGDVAAGVAAIGRLTDAGERERIARGGLDLVRSRYSVASSVAAWHEALLGTLASAPAGRRSRPAPVAPAGRLDRALGGALGERVRELLGRRPAAAADPGAEWPHSYGLRRPGDPAFARRAAELDRVAAGGRLS
jgi:hypothetical protein